MLISKFVVLAARVSCEIKRFCYMTTIINAKSQPFILYSGARVCFVHTSLVIMSPLLLRCNVACLVPPAVAIQNKFTWCGLLELLPLPSSNLLRHNVFYQRAGHPSELATPPSRAQLSVQLLHNHILNLSETLTEDRLDLSTLGPVVSLYVTFAARWWCPCTRWWGHFLVTLLDYYLSLCDQPLTFLSLQHSSTCYILSSYLTLASLAVIGSA